MTDKKEENKTIILVGGPGSGKSNYLARLWLAVSSQRYNLTSLTPPQDLDYIEGIVAHLLQGKFVPRTESEEKNREFDVSIQAKNTGLTANIIVPDMYGEIWDKAVSSYEIPEKWLTVLRSSTGALLFVRVRSDHNIQPLDWVTTQGFLKAGLGSEKNSEIPTQISLLELLRFIDENISRVNQVKSKVAVIIAAWDLLDEQEKAEGPNAYLENQFPMFAGRLSDIDSLNVKVFGCSIVGGDLEEEEFEQTFLNGNIEETGYIVHYNEIGELVKDEDVTKPINWLLE